ncbi:hypothetical protein ASF92_19050 [Pedobacter sp. Leaf176]|nr:hypothetical protein ASF92_19050 [Pedobacter sp. Leaf176]
MLLDGNYHFTFMDETILTQHRQRIAIKSNRLSFFPSAKFPTIFSLVTSGSANESKIALPLIVMPVVGGALLILSFPYLSDLTQSMHCALAVPAFCFLLYCFLGRSSCTKVLN